MTITLTQAIGRITPGMTVSQLQALANTVDAGVGNSTLLLYSGGVGNVISGAGTSAPRFEYGAGDIVRALSNGDTVKTIDNTDASTFLRSPQLEAALVQAIAADPAYAGRSVDQVLNGFDSSNHRITSNSFWDDASRNLVNQHNGAFELVMPNAPGDSVAMQTEIPALLGKSGAANSKVNGVGLDKWQQAYDVNYNQTKNALIAGGMNVPQAESRAATIVSDEIKSVFQESSKANLGDLSIAKTGSGLTIDTNNSYYKKALDLPNISRPSGLTYKQLSGVDLMGSLPSSLPLLAKYGDVLNKAGIIGDILGTGIAIAQAQAALNAGDPHAAGEIIASHVGGLMGGFAGGTISTAVVTAILLTPGVNVAALTGILIALGAGIVGGYVGGAAGEKLLNDLYNRLDQMGLAPLLDTLIDDYAAAIRDPSLIIEVIKNLIDAAIRTASPLVLDVDGSGTIELTSLTGANAHSVYFDVNNDGYSEATAWVTGGDGLLCIDKNGNGTIDSGGELFGDQTGKTNGFISLAQYDSNQDGKITAEDQKFDQLRVWIDANEDGFSQGSELKTLSELNITNINLGYNTVNTDNNGNTIKQTGTFTMNGVDRAVVDAYFKTDNTNSVYNRDYTLDPDVLFMPTLRGYGQLADLHIAMSLDNTAAGNDNFRVCANIRQAE